MLPLFSRVVAPAVISILVGFARLALAESAADPAADLYKACYLENNQRDYAAARAIFDKLVADDAAPEPLRDEARRHAEHCRDELAADNMASLVPPNVMAFVEVRRPLALGAELAESLGLAGRDIRAALAGRPDTESALPFNIPKEITLSPALVDALSSFGGLAIALTDMKSEDHPEGVAIIHHGNCTLMKGLLETAVQFAPTTKKIAGLPTFKWENKAIGVLTDSLLIVGSNRGLVEGAVARLEGRDKDSLASREDLKEINARRAGATLFAFADAPSLLKQIKAMHIKSEHDQREYAEADAFVDFDKLRWACFSFGVHDRRIAAELTVRLADDHRCLVYDLIRMPSMTRRTFGFVPGDAVGFAGLGLNPPTGLAPRKNDEQLRETTRVSGLDILREIFGNMQEATAFTLPGGGTTYKSSTRRGDKTINSNTSVPDAGLVIASNDVARSAALWDRILAIPARMQNESGGAETIDVQGESARAYQLPEGVKVFMAEADDCLILTTTKSALRRALQAHKSKKTIETDPVMQAALKNAPRDASFMVIVHGGRAASMAANQADMPARMPLNIASESLKETIFWVGIGEGPSEFSFRIGLTGLPDLNSVIQKVGPLANMAAQFSQPQKGSSDKKHDKRKRVVRNDADSDDN